MGVVSFIRDAVHRNFLKINYDGSINVSPGERTVSVSGKPSAETIFEAFLTDDGTADGNNSANVDGSSVEQEFSLPAAQDYDIMIHGISLWMEHDKAIIRKFMNLDALTNGITVHIQQNGLNRTAIDQAKTLKDLLLNTSEWAIITGIDASNDQAFHSIKYFSVPQRLGRGTNDHISLHINDDLSTLLDFKILVIGTRVDDILNLVTS